MANQTAERPHEPRTNNNENVDPPSPNRERWKHEDELINHRLSWLLVSQTILFAGYGLVSGGSDGEGYTLSSEALRIGGMIPWLGLGTSLAILIGVGAAAWALWKLKKQYPNERLDVSTPTTILGWTCAGSLPVLFVVAWIVLIAT